MKTLRGRSKTKAKVRPGQQRLAFATPHDPDPMKCHVVAVGKRRDGGTRYWCLMHKADATAKYGRPAPKCRYADVPPIASAEMLSLDVDKYPGGVACWGAVPPVYDTTALPLDRGIHVHARLTPDGRKQIDTTYRRVALTGKGIPASGIEVTELDAIYYMVSSVFGYKMREVICTHCGYSHLDKDWFSVHAHRRHLCSGCGKQFRDTEISVGNPIAGIQSALKLRKHKVRAARKKLNIKQSDFRGGLQIWGSNPALIWTGDDAEEEGIHVHAFKTDGDELPFHDDTYSEVVIDGIKLDPVMVRVLMAQNALPHISERIVCKTCPHCKVPQFRNGEEAYTPTVDNKCVECGRKFASAGRLRKTVSNPLVAVLERLAAHAPRRPQKHDLGLIPETL
jgi:transposase-like protein